MDEFHSSLSSAKVSIQTLLKNQQLVCPEHLDKSKIEKLRLNSGRAQRYLNQICQTHVSSSPPSFLSVFSEQVSNPDRINLQWHQFVTQLGGLHSSKTHISSSDILEISQNSSRDVNVSGVSRVKNLTNLCLGDALKHQVLENLQQFKTQFPSRQRDSPIFSLSDFSADPPHVFIRIFIFYLSFIYLFCNRSNVVNPLHT